MNLDALQPSDMVHVGDDPFPRLTRHRCDQGHAARRHIGDLTWKFAPVGEHITPEQVDPHPLKSPALLEFPRTRRHPAIAMPWPP